MHLVLDPRLVQRPRSSLRSARMMGENHRCQFPSGSATQSRFRRSGGEMTLTIRELPAAERPRERLRTHGAQALSSSELIAILLGSGSEGRSALGIGQEIL